MKNIPQHIVLFPDGNRRWAKQKGLVSFDGHLAGKEKFNDFLFWCKNAGVKVVTVFGFSSENWKRSKEEVNYLMGMFEKYLSEGTDKFKEEEVQVRIIGQKERLPESLQKVVKKVEEETKNNSKVYLNLAVSYGGKWDILNAAKKIIDEKIPAKKLMNKFLKIICPPPVCWLRI